MGLIPHEPTMQSQRLKKINWERRLNQGKSAFLIAFVFSLIALIAIVDHYVYSKIAFGLLYLIPIALTSIRFKMRICLMVMAVTVAVGLAVNLIHAKEYAWVWTPYINAALRVFAYTFLILIQDRLKIEAAYARVDSLTGLLNRRAFWEVVEAEVERCKRYQRPVSVAYVDVDDFKTINDRYGHSTGDRFLKTFANTLRKATRTTDFVARLGGDEFAVLMPETDDKGVQFVLKRLNELAQIMNKHLFSITVSVGAATFLKAPVNAEMLISAADQQMYLTKQKGKNGIESIVIR